VFVALPVAGCVDTPPAQTKPNESAGEPSTGHHTITVTDATFQSEVLANKQLVLVDVWASWCGPCVRLAPIVEEIAATYEGRVTVAKLNADENVATMTRYDVTGLPTLLFIRDGRVLERETGYRTKQEIAAKLDALLASN
jgi:thioredoxin 1